MDVKLHEIGTEKSRVVVVDDLIPDAHRFVETAAAMAPFDPEAVNYYPGLRRIFTQADTEAWDYVSTVLTAVAQFVGGAFNATGFTVNEASFSIVTHRPEQLRPAQRIPHFDSPDQNFVAVLHYLNDIPNTGTCFYRHRATGFERITPQRAEAFATMRRLEGMPSQGGFIGDSNTLYEQLLRVDGRFNRLLIYQGALLHSGFIPHDFTFSGDPRSGRLTGNLFIQLK